MLVPDSGMRTFTLCSRPPVNTLISRLVMSIPAPKADQSLPSATGGIARLAYYRAKAAGIMVKPILQRVGLCESQMLEPQVRLSVRDQIALLNLVANALDDDRLGFHLAQVPDLREI